MISTNREITCKWPVDSSRTISAFGEIGIHFTLELRNKLKYQTVRDTRKWFILICSETHMSVYLNEVARFAQFAQRHQRCGPFTVTQAPRGEHGHTKYEAEHLCDVRNECFSARIEIIPSCSAANRFTVRNLWMLNRLVFDERRTWHYSTAIFRKRFTNTIFNTPFSEIFCWNID